MKSDIEISQQAILKGVTSLYSSLSASAVVQYGPNKAKIDPTLVKSNKQGKLVLVTAITPTPAGEGKTTTTIGLADAMRHIGLDSVVCLREPALGPVFGTKGGATGGGYAQVAPMEDINLHFTGDFHAIACAHNLLSSLIDNHLHFGNQLALDPNRITWGRVSELNDRGLRQSLIGIGKSNGVVREESFDIVVASEVMACFCLAKDFSDLQQRIGDITIGYTTSNTAVTARDLGAVGSMTALLKEAFNPNLVQTLENTPAIIHGGPFANIAHGCNSVVATKLALQLNDYVVTEAGFGADLGAEKFINIKCRQSGITPDAVVLVATVRALKYHGHGDLTAGFDNLQRHYKNITEEFRLPCVVAINQFSDDTEENIKKLADYLESNGIEYSLCTHWAEGGAGAIDLAKQVEKIVNANIPPIKYTYNDSDDIVTKITKLATHIYKAQSIAIPDNILRMLDSIPSEIAKYPICVAKTQSSFSDDAQVRNAPVDHTVKVREIRICTGAKFIVVICGNILTMPGLPKEPNAYKISIDGATGNITGLS